MGYQKIRLFKPISKCEFVLSTKCTKKSFSQKTVWPISTVIEALMLQQFIKTYVWKCAGRDARESQV